MRDFDTDTSTQRGRRLADRDFKIAGLPFRLRASRDVSAEAVERYRVMWAQLIDPDSPSVTDPEYVEAFYDLMGGILEEGQLDHLRAAGEPGGVDDPFTIPEAIELAEWAIGVVASRPIGASSSSSPGSTAPTTAPAGSPSTAPSSSPAPVESIS